MKWYLVEDLSEKLNISVGSIRMYCKNYPFLLNLPYSKKEKVMFCTNHKRFYSDHFIKWYRDKEKLKDERREDRYLMHHSVCLDKKEVDEKKIIDLLKKKWYIGSIALYLAVKDDVIKKVAEKNNLKLNTFNFYKNRGKNGR